jgi:hypothetical protein
MRAKLAAAILLLLGVPAFAHRLDEYLQATIITLEKNRVDLFMRLVPGVAVAASVLGIIDKDGDGAISGLEQRAYAEQVLRDLSITIDGIRLNTQLTSVTFPTVDAINEGVGEIQFELSAPLPPAATAKRTLAVENHHQNGISAYLVNCLVPRDRDLRVTAQNRNENQSLYRLDYVQSSALPRAPSHRPFSGTQASWDMAMLLALLGLAILCGKQFVDALG